MTTALRSSEMAKAWDFRLGFNRFYGLFSTAASPDPTRQPRP